MKLTKYPQLESHCKLSPFIPKCYSSTLTIHHQFHTLYKCMTTPHYRQTVSSIHSSKQHTTPYNTHNKFLPILCDALPVFDVLKVRK